MQEVGGSIPPGSTKSSSKAALWGGFLLLRFDLCGASALCLMERAAIFIFSRSALS
jgi:hypothetical protein